VRVYLLRDSPQQAKAFSLSRIHYHTRLDMSNLPECGDFFLACIRGLTESLKFKLADAGRDVLSIAQSLNSVLPRSGAQMCHGFEKGPGGGRRRLENRIISVLLVFNRSFHLEKYLCKVVNALLSLRDI